MEPARWERVKELFVEASALPPAERARTLEAACAGDGDLREQVERLLRAHLAGPGPLDAVPAPVDGASASASPPPARIGPYRVLRELGRGGMGSVYLAERDEPGLRMTVAVKVVRPGMDSAFVVGRFHTERQILASLEHPGIARLYDGGKTDAGLPYFVMEYVDGQDLLSYCDERRLPLAARLRIFLRVCEAVQHAHQHLVVHRDLKPSNVLVTATGEPKLLDFGIAKLLSAETAAAGDETASVVRLMTPDYASPEQARGERITTATDTYSLGVILYQLLCGRHPHRAPRDEADHDLGGWSLRVLDLPSATTARGEKPLRPDVRATAASAAQIAARRQATPRRLRRLLRGDLDNIVMKALRREPRDRYATAAELRDDVRRHLEGFPVRARPLGRTYRVAKFLRRHRLAVAAGTAALVGLAAGLALAVDQARAARAALATSLLAQARFQRSTGRVGHRFETLDLVARAAALIGGTSRASVERVQTRTEAAAALALSDLRAVDRWPVFVAHYGTEIDFTRDLERHVTAAPEGGFAVFSTADRRRLRHFPGAPDDPPIEFRLSGDGRWVAATFQDGRAEVRALASEEPARAWPGTLAARTFVEFSPDSQAALVSIEGRGAIWHQLADAGERVLLPAADRPHEAVFDGTTDRLAVARGARCEVWRVPAGERLHSWTLPHRVSELAWSPDGRRLAVAYDGRNTDEARRAPFGVWILDAATGAVEADFADHEHFADRLSFDPTGRSLVSVGWDGRLIWRAGQTDGVRVLGEASPLALRFSPDGTRVAYSPTVEELALAEAVTSSVFREWRAPAASAVAEDTSSLAVSPDGALLAVAEQTRIRLWDTAAGEQIGVHAVPAKAWWITVFFHPDGRSLVYSADSFGVMQVDLASAAVPGGGPRRLTLGTARRIGPAAGFLVQGFAPDGRSLVVTESPQKQSNNDRMPPTVWYWPDMDPSRARKLAAGFPLVGYRLVAGGRWGVSTDNIGPDLWIWDPATGQRVRSLGLPGNVSSMSSRDTRWMVTSTRDRFALWDTYSWTSPAGWAPRAGQYFGIPGQFSPDARLFAVADLSGVIELRTLPAAREVVSLPPPQPLRVRDFTFSAAGDRLYVLRLDGRVYEWNLARLREQLAKLGLDWE